MKTTNVANLIGDCRVRPTKLQAKASLSGAIGSDRWAIYSRRKHDRNSDWTLATSGSEAWCKKELALYLRHELRGDWHGPHYRGPYEFELRHETYPNVPDQTAGDKNDEHK